MLQKIRRCMEKKIFQKLKGTVEVDEFHAGGSLKNMHYNKKLEAREKGIFQNKTLLQGFVERGGDAVICLIPDKTDSTLIAGILRHVEHGSTCIVTTIQVTKRFLIFIIRLMSFIVREIM